MLYSGRPQTSYRRYSSSKVHLKCITEVEDLRCNWGKVFPLIHIVQLRHCVWYILKNVGRTFTGTDLHKGSVAVSECRKRQTVFMHNSDKNPSCTSKHLRWLSSVGFELGSQSERFKLISACMLETQIDKCPPRSPVSDNKTKKISSSPRNNPTPIPPPCLIDVFN